MAETIKCLKKTLAEMREKMPGFGARCACAGCLAARTATAEEVKEIDQVTVPPRATK